MKLLITKISLEIVLWGSGNICFGPCNTKATNTYFSQGNRKVWLPSWDVKEEQLTSERTTQK